MRQEHDVEAIALLSPLVHPLDRQLKLMFTLFLVAPVVVDDGGVVFVFVFAVDVIMFVSFCLHNAKRKEMNRKHWRARIKFDVASRLLLFWLQLELQLAGDAQAICSCSPAGQ